MSSCAHKLGMRAELLASKLLHQQQRALLCSSLVLRERGLGQVDIAVISKTQLVVYEIKSRARLSRTQRSRLLQSTHFLGLIFDRLARLELWILPKVQATPILKE